MKAKRFRLRVAAQRALDSHRALCAPQSPVGDKQLERAKGLPRSRTRSEARMQPRLTEGTAMFSTFQLDVPGVG